MVERIRGLRMSPQQQHVWLLQREQAGTPHIAHVWVSIEGSIDTDRLRGILQEIIHTHEMFRAVFRHAPGIPVPIQVITDRYDFIWQHIDLQDLSPQEQTAGVTRFFEEERRKPIDIEQGPLLRAMLATLSASRHILTIDLPALCADTWTLNNIVREIGQRYQKGRPPDNEVAQYFDFSEWQNDLLHSEDAEPGKRYWQQQDLDQLSSPVLPFERRAEGDAPRELQTLTVEVDRDLSLAINELIQAADLSASACLLACWQLLLWRVCGQRDSVVRTMFDGRSYPEFYEIMGLFSRAIPIHVHLKHDLQWKQVAALLDSTIKEHADHQEYFTSKQAGIVPEDPSLLPVDFEFNDLYSAYHADGITLSPQQYSTDVECFKLKLTCAKRADRLSLEFRYLDALFSETGIAQLAEGLLALLTSVAANPAVRCDRVEIVSAARRQTLLRDLNDTRADYPWDQGLHQLFEEQAARTPTRTAVVCGGEHVTYADLNACANQLARYLRRLGVSADTPVGLHTTRSLGMVVGLLGILKAGGAYVPLDPQYPPERLAFILEETRAPLLLTEERLAALLPAGSVRRLCLDSDWASIATESADNLTSAITPDNLAYVIYTSGSTGVPKGVMIPHRGLVNYVSWCLKTYPITEGRGSPVHTPLGFDLTVTSLLVPLLAGQRVLLIPESDGVEGLRQALEQERDLSLVKITPTHLELLRQQMPAAQEAGRTKAFIIGGEMLVGGHVAFWRDQAPATRLINEYGPTETVVGCCTYEVPPGSPSAGPVPIGRPIANTQLYVLDANLEPVPVGVPGELFIGGDGLARGYFNQPALTAERFIPNPFAPTTDDRRPTTDDQEPRTENQEPRPGIDSPAHLLTCSPVQDAGQWSVVGGRLYRTGDLARYLPDGNLEFLGRIDHQVKLQGFRIELEEIEAVLRDHPVIREAAVAVREDAPNEQRLVAYLVTDQAPMPSIEELRAFLQRRLPAYMTPAVFMRLYALPLTTNGKLDRRALPAPEQTRPQLEQGYVAPRTDTEKTLAAIWQETLNLQQVGIYDNFFTLGGDSIRSVRIVALAGEQGLRFSVQQLFQHPTIHDLIQVIEQAGGSAEPADIANDPAAMAQILEALDGISDQEAREQLLELLKVGEPE